MTLYHCRVAIGHFARVLGRDAKRLPYAPVAVLSLLWLHAADPYASSVVVHVSSPELAGFVPSRKRLQQVLSELTAIGAVQALDFGYRLRKPAIDELDDIARAQIQTSPTVLGGDAAKARPTLAEREATAAARRQRLQDKRDAEARRRDALARLGRQPSEIRDVLVWMAGKPKDSLRYAGKGSGRVQAAIDWLASTGATWNDLARVCKAAKVDASVDKPQDLTELFLASHDGYLQRLVDGVSLGPRVD